MLVYDELANFFDTIKPRHHVALFYDSEESRRRVLFPFLADGLNRGRGVVYVYSDETPESIRRGLEAYGVDVEPNERAGNLIMPSYREWYIENGKVEALKIMSHWDEAHGRFSERGLGMRATGEITCFFREGKVRDLLRYEYALHKFLRTPMEAICAYDVQTIVETGYTDMIMPLIRAHGKAIFTAEDGIMILEPENIEASDVERLLEIEI
jgi:hypothetical protein